jgi:hypothetical protein
MEFRLPPATVEFGDLVERVFLCVQQRGHHHSLTRVDECRQTWQFD